MSSPTLDTRKDGPADRKIGVLFVCLGNICRSPMAEGVFRAEVYRVGLADRFEIESAGTGSWHIGDPPHGTAQTIAKEAGFDISDLRGRQISPIDFSRYDYILAMDRSNLSDLRALAPESLAHKAALLMSFVPDAGDEAEWDEVPDPYGAGPDAYRETLALCEQGARGLLAYIRRTEGI